MIPNKAAPASASHSIEEELKLIDLSASSLGDFESELQQFAQRLHRNNPQSFLKLGGHEAKRSSPQKPKKPIESYEPVKEMRSYPKICERSRKLAEKADARFFARFNIKPVQKSEKRSEKSAETTAQSKAPEEIKKEAEERKEPRDVAVKETGKGQHPAPITDAEVPSSPPVRLSIRERIEAYLNSPDECQSTAQRSPTIFERGQVWLQRRSQKLQSRATRSACTFAPVLYTKIPHHMQRMSNEDLLQFISHARSSTRATPVSRSSEPKLHLRTASTPAERKSFSPIVQKLSFASGCDWSTLVQRGTELG